MSFDSNSLERLRQLGRQLPQKLPKSNIDSSKKDTEGTQKVEINENKTPEDLFRELIEQSPDGNISPGLISQVKEAEKREKENKSLLEIKNIARENKKERTSYLNKKSNKEKNNKKDLYISFERLLLEEDDS